MRCLNCHCEEITPNIEICPKCGIYLPALLRDILTKGTLLRDNTYKIDYALGRGNFGITYCAQHSHLHHHVAIKEFYPQEYATRNQSTGDLCVPTNQQNAYSKGLKRFIQEGRMLVQLNHNHVVQVRDLFEERNTAYLVMDLIVGKTLTTILGEVPNRALAPERVENLIEQLVSALVTLHSQGIYHLDIKPDNILITPEDQLFLIDFGAAKQIASHPQSNRTLFFTESYAAPEIISGGEIGAWTDVFEMGMMLHEILLGELPTPALTRLIEGDSWNATLLSQPWRSLVESALHLNKENRPATVQEWWESRHKSTLKIGSVTSGQPMATTLRGFFVLPELKTKGMQQRLGRGEIKNIFPFHGHFVLVCSAGGATLFDFRNQNALWEIDCPTDSGAINADGTQLGLVWEKRVFVWSLQTGSLIRQVQGHEKRISAIAFDPKGKYLASASYDNTIWLWEIASGKVAKKLHGHSWGVTCVTFSPDGQWLISGSRDETVRVWDVANESTRQILENHKHGVESLVVSGSGDKILVGSRDCRLRLWDLNSGELLQKYRQNTWVRAVAISPDGQLMAAGSGIDDTTIRIWDIPSKQLVNQLSGHWSSLRTISFGEDNSSLVSAGYDYTVKSWDISSGEVIHELDQHSNWVYSVAISSDGQLVATGNNNSTITLWDAIRAQKLLSLKGHLEPVTGVVFSQDGQFLASCSWDKTVRLWEIPSGRLLKVFSGHQDFVQGVDYSWDGKIIASASWDNTVRLHDLEKDRWPLFKSVRILQGHDEEVKCVAISPDSLLVASGSRDRTIRLWDIASGQEFHCLEGHTASVEGVAFSADGKYLAGASRDRTLSLWHVKTGELVCSLLGHTGNITSVAFSPDGQWLVSGSRDQTLRLWDRTLRKQVHLWRGHTSWINSVTFSRDSIFVIAADNHGVVRFWRI